MSTSDDIKVDLSNIFGVTDWKRLSKQNLTSELDRRIFHSKKKNITTNVYTLIDHEIHIIYSGILVFGVAQDNDEIFVSIFDPFVYLSQEDGGREYIDEVLPYINNVIPSYLSLEAENCWMGDAKTHSVNQIIADMSSAGFVFNQRIHDEMQF